ncbi:MAG: hypothetical protein V1645_04575 [archaeon]
MVFDVVLKVLAFLASVVFLVAVYYSFKLSKETRHERYWLLLALGFFVFAIHHWTILLGFYGAISESTNLLVEQVSSIVGALLIAYSTYGLFVSMRRVREKLR